MRNARTWNINHNQHRVSTTSECQRVCRFNPSRAGHHFRAIKGACQTEPRRSTRRRRTSGVSRDPARSRSIHNKNLICVAVHAVGGTRTLFTSHFWEDYEKNSSGNTWQKGSREARRSDVAGQRLSTRRQAEASGGRIRVEIFGVGGGHWYFSGKAMEICRNLDL